MLPGYGYSKTMRYSHFNKLTDMYLWWTHLGKSPGSTFNPSPALHLADSHAILPTHSMGGSLGAPTVLEEN